MRAERKRRRPFPSTRWAEPVPGVRCTMADAGAAHTVGRFLAAACVPTDKEPAGWGQTAAAAAAAAEGGAALPKEAACPEEAAVETLTRKLLLFCTQPFQKSSRGCRTAVWRGCGCGRRRTARRWHSIIVSLLSSSRTSSIYSPAAEWRWWCVQQQLVPKKAFEEHRRPPLEKTCKRSQVKCVLCRKSCGSSSRL